MTTESFVLRGLREAAEDGVRAILEYLTEDADREGLVDTPARFVRAMLELSSGLLENPTAYLDTTFAADCDELVVVRQLPFTSLCEHHLLPFTGHATIGYLPGERVVGLSKLPRVLDAYARRPQIQEQLTSDVARTIFDHHGLAPRGVAVVVRATHTCMSLRGVRKDGEMVTSALLGELRDNPNLRAEFLALERG